MSDARSLVDEMRVSQAEHLPLVAAFLERMGLAAVVNAAVPCPTAESQRQSQMNRDRIASVLETITNC